MPDPIDTDDLPDTERLRLNRDGYLEPWPDGMLCYYAHFKAVVSDLRADLSALRAREAEMRARLDEARAAWEAFEGATITDDHHAAVDRMRAALSHPARKDRPHD